MTRFMKRLGLAIVMAGIALPLCFRFQNRPALPSPADLRRSSNLVSSDRDVVPRPTRQEAVPSYQAPPASIETSRSTAPLAEVFSRFDGGDPLEWLNALENPDPVEFESRERFDLVASKLRCTAAQLCGYIDGLADTDRKKIAALLCLPYLKDFDSSTTSYLLAIASRASEQGNSGGLPTIAAIHALRLHGDWSAIGSLLSSLSKLTTTASVGKQSDTRALVLALRIQNQESITVESRGIIDECLARTECPEVRRAAVDAHACDVYGNGPSDVVRLALQGDTDAISSLRLICDDSASDSIIRFINSMPTDSAVGITSIAGAMQGLLMSSPDKGVLFVTESLDNSSMSDGVVRSRISEAVKEAIANLHDPRALPAVFDLRKNFIADPATSAQLRASVENCSKGLAWRTIPNSYRETLRVSLRKLLSTRQIHDGSMLDIAYALILIGDDNDIVFVESQLAGSPEAAQLPSLISGRRPWTK